MIRAIKATLCILIAAVSVEAATYTVKAGGGGNYTTIQACATAMNNGDTCVVYAGTYNEHVNVPAGGAGALKTLQVNGTDVVNVYDFTLNSYTKIVGFHITNPASVSLAANCITLHSGPQYVYITGNTFTSCASSEAIHAAGSYVFVQNNVLFWPCSSPSVPDVCYGIGWAGDHWLIEGNDISHTLEGVIGAGSYSVIRNNTYHDTYGTDPLNKLPEHDCTPTYSGTVTADGSNTVAVASGNNFQYEFPGTWIVINGVRYKVYSVNLTANPQTLVVATFPDGLPTTVPAGTWSGSGGHGSNCHMNMVISEPSTPTLTQYNLIEGNTESNIFGNDGHAFLAQGDGCGGECFNLIIRFNIAAHVGSSGVVDNNDAKPLVNPGFYNIKSYNNSWIDINYYGPSSLSGITNSFTYNSINGSEINDLFYYPESITGLTPYTCDDRGTGASTCSTFTARNNLAWCTGATCTLYGEVYQRGTFTADPGNIKADPTLANYAGNDFHLSGTSPAMGAGGYLATVAANDTGAGTTLLVNDVAFFQDGYGLPNLQADQIRVGTSTLVQIKSINYATNTLTLVTPITRSAGDPIYLFSDSNGRIVLFGNAPNIGALPTVQQQAPGPPSGLSVSVR